MAELERVEQQIGVSLAAWGAASVVGGVALGGLARTERMRAFGWQTAGWGSVDLAIAGLAHLRASRRHRPLSDSERSRLHRVLLVNAVLDAGYMVGGAAIVARADRLAARWPPRGRPRTGEQLRGDGTAVVVQGLYLLVHDCVFAVRTRREPEADGDR